MTDNVFPNKLRDVLILDAGISFYLYLLAKVVCGHKQKFLLNDCDKQGPHYVHPPLREWPRVCYWVENFEWNAWNGCMSLALVTLFDIAFRVLLHGGPIVSLRVGTMR